MGLQLLLEFVVRGLDLKCRKYKSLRSRIAAIGTDMNRRYIQGDAGNHHSSGGETAKENQGNENRVRTLQVSLSHATGQQACGGCEAGCAGLYKRHVSCVHKVNIQTVHLILYDKSRA